ncbi:MAG: hypothetical protein U9O78_03390 [Patescibacteria group bacterium]|nr:hypothetical protein [Patescibacteria group bacterium]
MKAYFSASVSGKKELGKNYKKILDSLNELGLEVLNNHVLTTSLEDLKKVGKKEEQSFYKQLKSWLSEADLMVAEVSKPSTNVGHEVSLALSKNKPVILLYLEGRKPLLFDGIQSEKLQLIKYDVEGIVDELKMAIEYATESRDTRFNFFISPKHQNYLDWIAKNKRIPRSVFLRQLIEEHMRDNENYS